jgi:OOP family OmpA-OmpF porin
VPQRTRGQGRLPGRRRLPRSDNDGDGIPDALDKCPNDPEDKDGFQDEDGCPDPDNDHDGIPDNLDKCPNEPEDFDGFQDQDGCPDPDNDGDGIPDKRSTSAPTSPRPSTTTRTRTAAPTRCRPR